MGAGKIETYLRLNGGNGSISNHIVEQWGGKEGKGIDQSYSVLSAKTKEKDSGKLKRDSILEDPCRWLSIKHSLSLKVIRRSPSSIEEKMVLSITLGSIWEATEDQSEGQASEALQKLTPEIQSCRGGVKRK